MTFERKAVLLGAAALILLTTYILGTAFSVRRETKIELPGGGLSRAAADTRRIMIVGDRDVLLEREGDGWIIRVEGIAYPAAAVRVNGFLDTLGSLDVRRIVSRDPGYWKMITGGQAGGVVSVALTDERGTVLSEIDFTASEPGSLGIYARVRGYPFTFQAADISSSLRTDIPYWGDLRVLPGVSRQSVVEMRFSADLPSAGDRSIAESYTLYRSAENGAAVWRIAGMDADADQTRVESLAGTVTGLRGDSFALAGDMVLYTDDTSAGRAAVTLIMENGRSFTVGLTGSTESDRYLVRTNTSDTSFLVSGPQADRLFPPVGDLFAGD